METLELENHYLEQQILAQEKFNKVIVSSKISVAELELAFLS